MRRVASDGERKAKGEANRTLGQRGVFKTQNLSKIAEETDKKKRRKRERTERGREKEGGGIARSSSRPGVKTRHVGLALDRSRGGLTGGRQREREQCRLQVGRVRAGSFVLHTDKTHHFFGGVLLYRHCVTTEPRASCQKRLLLIFRAGCSLAASVAASTPRGG